MKKDSISGHLSYDSYDVIGKCRDCPRDFKGGGVHPNAKRHAISTGHTVDVLLTYHYNPK